MQQERLRLVRETWRDIEPDAAAAGYFYDKLFELDPAARALFAATDMAAQRSKVIEMLTRIVAATEDEERFVIQLAELGRRHAGYGVRAVDYDAVGVALLSMVERGLSERFTADVREAWAETYRLIAGVMLRAQGREGNVVHGSVAASRG